MNALRKKFGATNTLLAITIALFIIMYIIGMVIFKGKGFNHFQTFANIFISNAGLLVCTVGMTMVMLTGGIDISVGSMIGVTCMILADLMENKGFSLGASITIAMLFGVVFGVVQGFLVAYLEIQPFIVTLAGLFFARGLTAVISQNMVNISNEAFHKISSTKIMLPKFLGYINNKGKNITPFIYWRVIFALLVVFIMWYILKYTKFGRSIYALGGSEQSAKLMGLNVKRTKFYVYVLNGLIAAFGGLVWCMNQGSGFVEQARGVEMDCISSSVIGGTMLTGGVGTVWGSLFGVMINGTIQTLISDMNLNSWWNRIITSLLMLVFIVLQSIFNSISEKNR